jgi:hypothetical protein
MAASSTRMMIKYGMEAVAYLFFLVMAAMDKQPISALQPNGERMRDMVDGAMVHHVPLMARSENQQMAGTAGAAAEFPESMIEP